LGRGSSASDTDMGPGARLASLFGMDQTSSGTGNEFFQYTAPKQPKKNLPKPPPPAGAPSVFVATAVHAYRFTNGTYVKQGKYGAAVVGCHTTQEYRILLYINQQQQITSARIHPGFIQPNNYGTFYDDQRQNWSLMFESEKAAVEFSKQLCLAKYNSSPSPDSVTCQDLILGDGPAVEVGDALEVAFTGWLFQNSALGQVFDSNVNKEKLLRLKLGSGKIIKGWEEGMLGLKKGSKRFLVIPPALAYGSQGVANRVPPDSTLAFEVEVKRVSRSLSFGVPRDSLAPSPGPNTEHLSADPAGSGNWDIFSQRFLCFVRCFSLSPSLSSLPPSLSFSLSCVKNPDMAKAKLISRMAKMGQPMLPFLSGSAPAQLDSSDSEIEVGGWVGLRNWGAGGGAPNTSPKDQRCSINVSGPQHFARSCSSRPQVSAPGLQVSSAAVMPTALHPHPALPGSSQSLQAYTGMNYAYPQGPASASQLQPMGPIFPAPFQAAGDIGTFLMTEARQQNTEIRLSVGRVADKIDQLAAKMEELQKQNSTQSLLPGISSVTMETAMIMANIQRIIQENERLKQEVFEKSSRIEEQNEKISELIQRNQRYVEQSNLLMEQRNSSLQMNTEHSQARVLHAEQEKVKVAEELAAATAQVSRLQLELTSHQKKEMDLRSQLNAALKESERHAAQLNQLQAQLAELQESSEKAKNKFQAEKQSRKQLDGKLAALEEELADLRVEKENLEKNLSERKKKSLLERKQAEEEADEIRKSYQEEMDQLRLLLKKSRASTNNVASEQLSLLQTELESQWEARCERLLSSAKEQHARQFQEVCEQRDAQQQVISQLEEKCAALQSQLGDLTAHYEGRIQELTKSIHRTSPTTSGEEVKKIMNGVFHSLRGQFEIEESYTGRIVLGVVMSTIKVWHLRYLQTTWKKTPTVLSSPQKEAKASRNRRPSIRSPNLQRWRRRRRLCLLDQQKLLL
uniref:peptidylprolyl isomerase n=1 Tax=Pseudonaja textilis TaxID=8673 RepID=A0A670ZP03_PSETE